MPEQPQEIRRKLALWQAPAMQAPASRAQVKAGERPGVPEQPQEIRARLARWLALPKAAAQRAEEQAKAMR